MTCGRRKSNTYEFKVRKSLGPELTPETRMVVEWKSTRREKDRDGEGGVRREVIQEKIRWYILDESHNPGNRSKPNPRPACSV